MLDPNAMSKKTILIVENNPDCRDLLRVIFTQSGYETIEACNGPEAISQARSTQPDLIIMDIGLPGISGEEAMLCLKADPATRDIPIFVNTAHPKSAAQVQHAIAAGAAAIIHKPVSFRRLQKLASRYLALDPPSGSLKAIHAVREI